MDSWTDKQTGRQRARKTDRQIARQTDKELDKQTDIQTDRQPDGVHVCGSMYMKFLGHDPNQLCLSVLN